MVNFHRDLASLSKRATMIFCLIRENDDTTLVSSMLGEKRYEPVLAGEEYFREVEKTEEGIRQKHNETDQEMLGKYYKSVEEYYIQWEQIYLYLQKVESLLDNLGEKYLEFSSVEELLSSNQVDKGVQQSVYELLHHYLAMCLLSETQMSSRHKEALVVFYYRHSTDKHIKYIEHVRQLTCSIPLQGLSPLQTLNKQVNRLHLPRRLIKTMLKHLLSHDIYESPTRHSNRLYQHLRRNRLIATFLIANLDDAKQQFTTEYDLNRQFMNFAFHEVYDSLFINASQLFTSRVPVFDHKAQYKGIQEIQRQTSLYNEKLSTPLNQLNEVVEFIYSSNTTIRQYLIQHHFTRLKVKMEVLDVVQALLCLSTLEMNVDSQYESLLSSRESQYKSVQEMVLNRLELLMEFFGSPERESLNESSQQEGYSEYFRGLKENVAALEIGTENYLLKQQLIQGQKNILKYKSMQNNLQIVSHLQQNIDDLQQMVLLQKTKENLIGNQHCIDSYLVELLDTHMEVVQLCLEGGCHLVEGLLYRLGRLAGENQRRVQGYLHRMVVKVGQLVAEQLVTGQEGRYHQIQLINRISQQVKSLQILRRYTLNDPQSLLEQTISQMLTTTLTNQFHSLDIAQPNSISTFISLQNNILDRLQMTQDLLQIQAMRFYQSITQGILKEEKVIASLLKQTLTLLSKSKTFYMASNMTFYDKQYQEVIGAQLFYKLFQVVGIEGLAQMDILIGAEITILLESLKIEPVRPFRETYFLLMDCLDYKQIVGDWANKMGKQVSSLAGGLVQIGRLSRLRDLIQQTVSLQCESQNRQQVALLSQINQHLVSQASLVSKESLLQIQAHSHQVGLHSVSGKVYTEAFLRDDHWVFMRLFGLLVCLQSSLHYQKVSPTCQIICTSQAIDTTLLAYGAKCLLEQYPISSVSQNLPSLLRRWLDTQAHCPRAPLLRKLLDLMAI